jgi:prepilin-type N-terminal cleavage/methylation domain-containing protein
MSERGVTLLELLIALFLGSVILLGGAAFYKVASWTTKTDYAQAYLQEQATIVMGELTRQIEAASVITRTNGDDSLPATCPNGVTTTLYLFQPNGSVYCFYASSGQLVQYRAPAGGGTPGTWNMLSGSPAPLTVTSLDFCGSPPYATCQTTSDIAYVSFRLQATGFLGGSGQAPTMTFAVAIAKRN